MPVKEEAYNQLLTHLRGMIHELNKGARLPSFRSLMKKFGCSQAIVDRVLDVLSEEKLIERRPASGVYVMGNKRQRADTVLFVVPDLATRNCALIVRGAEHVARQQGFRAEVHSFREQLKALPDQVINHCRALVLVTRGADVDTGKASEFLQSLPENLPVMLIENDIPGMTYPFFGYKDLEAGQQAARIFMERGIKRIACLGSSLSHISQTRLTGFARELGRYPDFMVDFPAGGFTHREGLKQIMDLGMQGVFISRPDIALQSMCYLEALGARVPGDLFIVTIAEENDSRAYPFEVISLIKPSAKTSRDALRALLAGLKTRKRVPYALEVPASLHLV